MGNFIFEHIILIVFSGRQHVCKKHEEEKVYLILEKKLWDDPTRVGILCVLFGIEKI